MEREAYDPDRGNGSITARETYDRLSTNNHEATSISRSELAAVARALDTEIIRAGMEQGQGWGTATYNYGGERVHIPYVREGFTYAEIYENIRRSLRDAIESGMWPTTLRYGFSIEPGATSEVPSNPVQPEDGGTIGSWLHTTALREASTRLSDDSQLRTDFEAGLAYACNCEACCTDPRENTVPSSAGSDDRRTARARRLP